MDKRLLGKKASEIERLSGMGLSSEELERRMTEDAKVFGMKLDDYQRELLKLRIYTCYCLRCRHKAQCWNGDKFIATESDIPEDCRLSKGEH